MKFKNMLKSTMAGTVLALGSYAASATPLYFFGNGPTTQGQFPTDPTSANYAPVTQRNAFLAAVAVSATQDFETSAVGELASTGNTLAVFGTGTLSQAVPNATPYRGADVKNGSTSNGRFNTTNGAASGGWIQTDSNFTIDLGNTSVGAFGFFGTDFGDFRGSLQIAIYAANGDLIDNNIFTDASDTPLEPRDSLITASQDGSLLYFGYASDRLFNRIVFTVGQISLDTDNDPFTPPVPQRDVLGFDDLTIGNLRSAPPTPAPEPGSFALVGLALFAAGWARKTQRRV